MATGVEWMLTAVMQHLGINPDHAKKQLADTVQIVVGAKEQLDRIEARQIRILELLGDANPERDYGQLTEQPSAAGKPADPAERRSGTSSPVNSQGAAPVNGSGGKH